MLIKKKSYRYNIRFKNPKWKRNSYFEVVAKIKLDEKREVKCGFNLILMRALSVENNEELLFFYKQN